MESGYPYACPRDLWIEVGIPPNVIGVDDGAHLLGREPLGEVQRLGQRHDHRPIAGEHRVQRVDPETDAALASVRGDFRNPVSDHGASAINVAVWRGPANQDQYLGPQLGRFVHSAAVVVDSLSSLHFGRGGGETPPPQRPNIYALPPSPPPPPPPPPLPPPPPPPHP